MVQTGNRILGKMNMLILENEVLEKYNTILDNKKGKYVYVSGEYNDNVEITVIITTYLSIFEKLRYTIESVIHQNNTKINIIITDDGSDSFDVEAILILFKENNFSNYKIITHEKNQGTVSNCYDGIIETNAKYVKFIGPGDIIYGTDTIRKWIDTIEKSEKKWSFCEAVFYDAVTKKVVNVPAHPQKIDCYLSGNDRECMWHYLALDDYPIGATILFVRDAYLPFISMMVGKVKYTEDNIFRLLMYNDILPLYYNEIGMLYEYGSGISTVREKKWNERLQIDKQAIDAQIVMCDVTDKFHEDISKVIGRKYETNRLLRLIYKLFEKGRIIKALKYRICPRLTPKLKEVSFFEKDY